MVYFSTYFYFKNYITKIIILININMEIKDGILFNKKKESFNLINEDNKSNDELLTYYSETVSRIGSNNSLKNKNIKINLIPDDSEPINEFGYVNNVGVLRPYMNNVDYRTTTWGKYGCPTYLSTSNVSNTPVKLNSNNLYEIETDPTLINTMIPMIPGQACGFEGENIYVNSIGDLKNYTTNYKGSYISNLPNVDDDSNLFNYDLCKTRAIDQGKRFFGLNKFDKVMMNSHCVVSNNIDDFKQSVMEGNIVYTSSVIPAIDFNTTNVNQILIEVNTTQLSLYRSINRKWVLTKILATYNTNETDECYNSGTFSINDIHATWGGNCNARGRNVPPDNALPYITNSYKLNSNNGKNIISSFNYQIGTDGRGYNIKDAAFGCPKNFSINYKCGNVTKTNNIKGESWGKNVAIDCLNEYNKCKCVLVITDEGYIHICKYSDATIKKNILLLNNNAKPFFTWDFSNKIDQSNESLIFSTNYMNEKIFSPNTYICSPNKKLAMTCDKDTLELTILTYSNNTVKIDDLDYGLNNTNAVYEITNLPKSNNIGKIAWINSIGFRKEYPTELLEKSNEYDMIPGWRSVGNDIFMAKMSVEDGKNWCNNNIQCAGFEFTNGICYFKNKNMYPNGSRQPNLGGSQLYIRKNKIKSNDSSCNKKINNVDNLTWEHYIPDIFNGSFMTKDYNCNNNLLNPNLNMNLNPNKDKLVNQLNNLDTSIFNKAKDLINNTTSLNEENNFLYNSMKENFENSDTNNQLNDITYLNTLLSNSKKFVIQKSYIIISLLTILLGLIIVLYKIKK